MAAPFAYAADVAARWRVLSSDEEAVASVLAQDASGMIRARWPDVDTRIASGALSFDEVLRVVVGMVKRAMIASDSAGLESASQTVGPFGVTRKYANSGGSLYLSKDDLLVFEPVGYRPVARMGWLG